MLRCNKNMVSKLYKKKIQTGYTMHTLFTYLMILLTSIIMPHVNTVGDFAFS